MGRNREKDLVQIEQTKMRLMNAGETVILERGLQQARVRDIVRLADVGIGTFYFHFRDIEHFQNEVLRKGIDELRTQIRDARGFSERTALENPEITLRKSFSTFFDVIDQKAKVALILLRERAGAGSFGKLFRRQVELFVAEFKDELEKSVQIGAVRKDVCTTYAAEAIIGMTLQLAEGYAERRVSEAESAPPGKKRNRRASDERELIISTLVQMTLHGLYLPTVTRGRKKAASA
jgi:AcrR family transcriptional regulator